MFISNLGFGKVFINEASGVVVQEGMSSSLNVSILLVNETTYESDVSNLRSTKLMWCNFVIIRSIFLFME